jgi:hypothetical protein
MEEYKQALDKMNTREALKIVVRPFRCTVYDCEFVKSQMYCIIVTRKSSLRIIRAALPLQASSPGILDHRHIMWIWLLGTIVIPLLLYLYIRHNDKCLTRLPPEALAFSPTRYTENIALTAAKRFAENPISMLDQMPPKTGRRYIVVGGVCLLPWAHACRTDQM